MDLKPGWGKEGKAPRKTEMERLWRKLKGQWSNPGFSA